MSLLASFSFLMCFSKKMESEICFGLCAGIRMLGNIIGLEGWNGVDGVGWCRGDLNGVALFAGVEEDKM